MLKHLRCKNESLRPCTYRICLSWIVERSDCVSYNSNGIMSSIVLAFGQSQK